MTESRRIDRLHAFKELLGRRRIVYRSELLDKFGISRATLNRDFAKLRNRYQVPIDFIQDYGGYWVQSKARLAQWRDLGGLVDSTRTRMDNPRALW